MPKTRIRLKVSEEVASGTDVADTFVVPDGVTVRVTLFSGEAPSSNNATCRLIWDYGGAGEVSEWVIQVDNPMLHVPEFVGDGVKKLAACCDNGCTDDYFMASIADLEHE